MFMATKTITITEESYHLLAGLKEGDESFSEELRRLLGTKSRIMELAGAWEKMSGKEAKEIHQAIASLRTASSGHVRQRIR